MTATISTMATIGYLFGQLVALALGLVVWLAFQTSWAAGLLVYGVAWLLIIFGAIIGSLPRGA